MLKKVTVGALPDFAPTLIADQEPLLRDVWENKLHCTYLEQQTLYETVGVFIPGESSEELRSSNKADAADFTLLTLVLHGEAKVAVRRLHDIPGRPHRTWRLLPGNWIAVPPQHAMRFSVLGSERVLIGKLTIRTYAVANSVMVG